MKRTSLGSLTLAVALALGAAFAAEAAGPRPATTWVAPTADEIADMTWMREEEKLARDLYLAFDEAWGTLPFASIAASEQRHMDAMLRTLVKNRLPDPVAGNAIGEFTEPRLQSLFADMLARGLASEAEALKAGGLVEEVDIRDNLDAAAATTKPDLDSTYAALTCGSRNHLRAFAYTLKLVTGETYTAQFLPQAEVDAILAAPLDRCGRP